MNDIQTKENIYSLSCAAVEKQQDALIVAQNKTMQMQMLYREAVVNVAIESEKLRRKKDLLVMMLILGIATVTGTVLILINSALGALFIVGFIAVTVLMKNNNQENNLENYKRRKDFFMKHCTYVRGSEEIKWLK